jgi:phage shock protein A
LRGRRDEQLAANNGQDVQTTKNSIFAKIRSNPEPSPQKAPILQKIDAQTPIVLKAQLDEETALVDNLKRQMIALESKISEAKTKKDLRKAQVAAAKANEQLQNTISQLDYSSIKLAFQLIEEKVLQREAYLEDREMLMQFFEAPCESLIRRLEEANAAKLKNKTVQKIREKILQIEVRLPARLQAIAVLICWKEELTNGKFQLLYRLILEQQDDLGSLGQLIRQLRQVNDSALFERAIEVIVAQKRNQLQYRQVQRVALRCQERAKLALQKGDEKWAREWLIRKNSFIKIASALKAKLDEQTPLVEELKLELKEWKNKFFDEYQTFFVDDMKRKLKEMNAKISEFSLLYCRALDSF